MSTESYLDLRLHRSGDVLLGKAQSHFILIRLLWSWPWHTACGPRHAGRSGLFFLRGFGCLGLILGGCIVTYILVHAQHMEAGALHRQEALARELFCFREKVIYTAQESKQQAMDDPEQWMDEEDEEDEAEQLELRNKLRSARWYSLAPTREQALITGAFRKLLPKISGYVDRFRITNSKLKMSPDFSSHCHRIKEILLPCMLDNLFRLCALLFSPAHFKREVLPEFQAGLYALKGIEEAVDQISAAMISFWLPEDTTTNSHPTELPDIKHYRCELTQSKTADIMNKLTIILDLYGSMLGVSIGLCDIEVVDETWMCMVDGTRLMRDGVNQLIEWFRLSDHGVLQDQWRTMAEEAEELLQHLAELPSLNSSIQIQRDSIALIKVSRLFFKKISQVTKSEFHPIWRMTPIQLAHFMDSTRFFPSVLEAFVYSIEHEPNPHDHNIEMEPTNDLVKYFEEPIRILNDYLESAHQGSNPTPTQVQSHHEFCEWHTTWNKQFTLAVDRFQATYREVHSGLQDREDQV
ncbi:hypothetical protein PGT21_006408 [Puccinia graminis f. sp. tritici]|nr:hypothetical protein PGT21_006408 [Puccinia graminis f. sp. tritici]